MPARSARTEAKRPAAAILQFHAQLASNYQQLQDVVGTMAADLLDLPGVGHVSAAQMLISYSHHGRVRSEAAFAALAGVNPLPSSSGHKTRHRLNRHGDRQLNRALRAIARSRMTCGSANIACVEWFVSRQVFRKLQPLLS